MAKVFYYFYKRIGIRKTVCILSFSASLFFNTLLMEENRILHGGLVSIVFAFRESLECNQKKLKDGNRNARIFESGTCAVL